MKEGEGTSEQAVKRAEKGAKTRAPNHRGRQHNIIITSTHSTATGNSENRHFLKRLLETLCSSPALSMTSSRAARERCKCTFANVVVALLAAGVQLRGRAG